MNRAELDAFIARAGAEQATELVFPHDSITDDNLLYLASESERLTWLRSLSLNRQWSVGDAGVQGVAERLTGLTSLDLSGCRVSDAGVVAVAKTLTGLTSLNLYGCRGVSDAGVVAVAKTLTGLTSLDLSGCRGVSDAGVVAVAKTLTGLTSLNLSGCRGVSDAGVQAVAKRLTTLTSLDLDDTQVRSLPAEFQRFTSLRYLQLPNNPELGLLPEILSNPQDPASILAHYFRGQREGKRQLNEAKVLVVGKEAVGKTSLVRYLLWDFECDQNERKTAGIAIERITVEIWPIGEKILGGDPLALNVWDFGGQEVMYETHRFFLSQRSLYLLVIEARREDDQSIHEWMKTIRNRAVDAPVIVVINKTEPPQELLLDETQLRRDYPAIKGVVATSCRTGLGIEELQKRIGEVIVEHLPHVRDWLPTSYFEVKKKLADAAKEASVLATHAFRNMCYDQQIPDEAEQDGLLRTLNEIGVVVAYREPDAGESLHNATLLDPNWVTTAVYKFLNHAEVTKANGEYAFADIGRFLQDPAKYPENWWRFIVAMMERFGLCFPLPDCPNRYLIPEQLRPSEPETGFDEQSALRLRYDYEFLPRGLVPRFIVQAHALYTSKPTAWLNGVVLQVEGCMVLVRGNREKKQVHIFVTGPEGRRRPALAVVRNHLEAVHRLNPESKPTEKVPLPDRPDLAGDYATLVRMEDAGKDEYWPDGATHGYSVKQLLNGVDSGTRRRPEPERGERGPRDRSESYATGTGAVALGDVDGDVTITINSPPPAGPAAAVPAPSDAPVLVAPDPPPPPPPTKWWQPLVGPGAVTVALLLLVYLLIEHFRSPVTLYYGVAVAIFAAVYLISSYYRWKSQNWAKRLCLSFGSAAIASMLAPGVKFMVKIAGYVDSEIEFGNSIWVTVVFLAASIVFGGIELYREKHQINAR